MIFNIFQRYSNILCQTEKVIYDVLCKSFIILQHLLFKSAKKLSVSFFLYLENLIFSINIVVLCNLFYRA